jgi:hypothetical protein
MAMRIGILSVPLLLAACATSATSGEGSSLPPQAAQDCINRGYSPGEPGYQDCLEAQTRTTAGTRGVVDTLYRSATMPR